MTTPPVIRSNIDQLTYDTKALITDMSAINYRESSQFRLICDLDW